MDKKCTLIAAALMVAGVFSANAQSSTTVPEAQCSCWSCVSIQEQEDTGRFVVCGFIYGKACYHIGRESVDIL